MRWCTALAGTTVVLSIAASVFRLRMLPYQIVTDRVPNRDRPCVGAVLHGAAWTASFAGRDRTRLSFCGLFLLLLASSTMNDYAQRTEHIRRWFAAWGHSPRDPHYFAALQHYCTYIRWYSSYHMTVRCKDSQIFCSFSSSERLAMQRQTNGGKLTVFFKESM